jgi:hypothetical protein
MGQTGKKERKRDRLFSGRKKKKKKTDSPAGLGDVGVSGNTLSGMEELCCAVLLLV